MKKIAIVFALVCAPALSLSLGKDKGDALPSVSVSTEAEAQVCYPPQVRCTSDAQCCSGFCDLYRIRWGICQ